MWSLYFIFNLNRLQKKNLIQTYSYPWRSPKQVSISPKWGRIGNFKWQTWIRCRPALGLLEKNVLSSKPYLLHSEVRANGQLGRIHESRQVRVRTGYLYFTISDSVQTALFHIFTCSEIWIEEIQNQNQNQISKLLIDSMGGGGGSGRMEIFVWSHISLLKVIIDLQKKRKMSKILFVTKKHI